MKTKVTYIKDGEKSYPLVFNLNVMEEIQSEYGSLEEWGNITQGGGLSDGKKNEPSIKDLKFGFAAMINEGIEIENEENGAERPRLTLKQVGRLISNVGITEVSQMIKNVTVASVKTEVGEKNG